MAPGNLYFSVIVPVFNRPDEIAELLSTLVRQTYSKPFEVVIVEDGSEKKSDKVLGAFPSLNIKYITKKNTGPGHSRNVGMQQAKGNYFIILDSDCLLPEKYLQCVEETLERYYTDFFGGPDTQHPDFSPLQKAINQAMTSFFTTGGIRGSESARKFQPRSFNMGISKSAFEASKGFGSIHPGEDPDLTLRLWKLGFSSQLISKAFVYHKRRISWDKFYKQVFKFGLARPILDVWHPEFRSLVYAFPTFFLSFEVLAFLVALIENFLPFYLLSFYFLLVGSEAVIQQRSLKIAFQAVWATQIQFLGYGYGFLKSFVLVRLLGKNPKKAMPDLFFEH